VSYHNPVRLVTRLLCTRSGLNVVAYDEVTCSCGDTYTVAQRGNYLRRHQGFNASDEVLAGRRHFRGNPSVKTLTASETVRVILDPEPLPPWTPEEFERLMAEPEPVDGPLPAMPEPRTRPVLPWKESATFEDRPAYRISGARHL
jgi:hypothetical protein